MRPLKNSFKPIESEYKFVFRQIIFILKIPWLLILILFRRKKLNELLNPLKELYHFIFQPKITIALIIINIIVFLLQITVMSEEIFKSLIFMPEHLFTFQIIPIVASWFLHASISHLLGNMLFLYIFGRIVEMYFGGHKMLLIYFGSAILGHVFTAIAGQGGIGASGAIAGLISTSILIAPFYLTFLVMGIPIPIVILGAIAIYTDISGILYPKEGDIVGHFAHLGGYLAVALIVFLFSQKQKEKMKKGLIINIITAIIMYIVYFYIIN
jgi:membrane associated rhomboid family serine protease